MLPVYVASSLARSPDWCIENYIILAQSRSWSSCNKSRFSPWTQSLKLCVSYMKMENCVWIKIESRRTVYKKNSKKETTLENETSSLPFFYFQIFLSSGTFSCWYECLISFLKLLTSCTNIFHLRSKWNITTF